MATALKQLRALVSSRSLVAVTLALVLLIGIGVPRCAASDPAALALGDDRVAAAPAGASVLPGAAEAAALPRLGPAAPVSDSSAEVRTLAAAAAVPPALRLILSPDSLRGTSVPTCGEPAPAQEKVADGVRSVPLADAPLALLGLVVREIAVTSALSGHSAPLAAIAAPSPQDLGISRT